MDGNIILNFLLNLFNNIWNTLFTTETPFFGISIGVILLGVTVISVLWSIVISLLQIGPSDFSNLGSPRDYFHKKKHSVKKNASNSKSLEKDKRSAIQVLFE